MDCGRKNLLDFNSSFGILVSSFIKVKKFNCNNIGANEKGFSLIIIEHIIIPGLPNVSDAEREKNISSNIVIRFGVLELVPSALPVVPREYNRGRGRSVGIMDEFKLEVFCIRIVKEDVSYILSEEVANMEIKVMLMPPYGKEYPLVEILLYCMSHMKSLIFQGILFLQIQLKSWW